MDLSRILNQCLELDRVRMAPENDGHSGSSAIIFNRINLKHLGFMMRMCVSAFQGLQNILGEQQKSVWDIKFTWTDSRYLRAHSRISEEGHWREGRGKHPIEGYLEELANFVRYFRLDKEINFVLILRDHEASKSYCVLGLCLSWQDFIPLPEAPAGLDFFILPEALARPDGSIYVRRQFDSAGRVWSQDFYPPIFIRYNHVSSRPDQVRGPIPETSNGVRAMGRRVIDDGRLSAHLADASPDFSASETAAALTPYRRHPSNQTNVDLGIPQQPAETTHFATIYPGPIREGFYKITPAGSLESTGVYSFTRISSTSPVNAIAQGPPPHGNPEPAPPTINPFTQGLLSYENRNTDRPPPIPTPTTMTMAITMTSPEADSPWSERDGLPPPYALSPGTTYDSRVEAAMSDGDAMIAQLID